MAPPDEIGTAREKHGLSRIPRSLRLVRRFSLFLSFFLSLFFFFYFLFGYPSRSFFSSSPDNKFKNSTLVCFLRARVCVCVSAE